MASEAMIPVTIGNIITAVFETGIACGIVGGHSPSVRAVGERAGRMLGHVAHILQRAIQVQNVTGCVGAGAAIPGQGRAWVANYHAVGRAGQRRGRRRLGIHAERPDAGIGADVAHEIVGRYGPGIGPIGQDTRCVLDRVATSCTVPPKSNK